MLHLAGAVKPPYFQSMRRIFTALPFVAMLLGLVLSLPALGLHGAAHDKVAAHHNHLAPAHPMPSDLPDDGDDIACKALCTGPLLTRTTGDARPPASHAAQPRTDAPRFWVDWVRPVSPPPKHLA
ncbi:hypothetical protein ACSSV8_000160 [Roseovarius sp. MBR-79]|jgi:hypothetical protein